MKNCIILLVILLQIIAKAQNPSEFLPEKPGRWNYSANIKTPDAEVVAFNKNLSALAEWFHQNVTMLTNPKGYDLLATTYGSWDKYYKMQNCNYGLHTELNFDFQLFFINGGKWTMNRWKNFTKTTGILYTHNCWSTSSTGAELQSW